MAIRMNATSHETHKDFRKTINIEKKMKEGKHERRIFLPPEDFSYGLKNRPPTPIKEVVNHGYGNAAADILRVEYRTFMNEKRQHNYLTPRTTPHFKKLLESRKLNENYHEPPLYKLGMFKNVPSKVTEDIKMFKTYHPKKESKIDHLIDKVQEEIKEIDGNVPKNN